MDVPVLLLSVLLVAVLKKKDLFRLLSMKQLLLDRGVHEARSLSLSEVD